MTSDGSVLVEAEKIINGERRDDYGPADESFDAIAAVWNVQLRRKLKVPITGHEVALLMCGFKLCRESNAHKRDNMVDLCGYAELSNQCYKKSS